MLRVLALAVAVAAAVATGAETEDLAAPCTELHDYESPAARDRALKLANRRLARIVAGKRPRHVVRTGFLGAETRVAWDYANGWRSSPRVINIAHVKNGIAPTKGYRGRRATDPALVHFASRYVSAIENAGGAARFRNWAPLRPECPVAYREQDDLLLRRFKPDVEPGVRSRGETGADVNVFDADVLDPFRLLTLRRPWTAALRGKRVLVLSSMADDIATQYRAYREGGRSWFPRDLLPRDLDLVTVTTPSSYRADVSNGNWSQALLDAERRVAAVGRVDVALVAAGAYGLPLGDFATRSMGATTIYVGGALQLFFGLRGLRWTEAIRPFENEAWSCPSSRPRGNTQGMEARGLGPYWCAPDRR